MKIYIPYVIILYVSDCLHLLYIYCFQFTRLTAKSVCACVCIHTIHILCYYCVCASPSLSLSHFLHLSPNTSICNCNSLSQKKKNNRFHRRRYRRIYIIYTRIRQIGFPRITIKIVYIHTHILYCIVYILWQTQ